MNRLCADDHSQPRRRTPQLRVRQADGPPATGPWTRSRGRRRGALPRTLSESAKNRRDGATCSRQAFGVRRRARANHLHPVSRRFSPAAAGALRWPRRCPASAARRPKRGGSRGLPPFSSRGRRCLCGNGTVASMAWSLTPSTTRAQMLQEVTPRRTVVGLVAALDDDDDAAVAAPDDGLALARTGAAGHQHCLVLRSHADSIASARVKAAPRLQPRRQRQARPAASLGVQRSSCRCNAQCNI